MKRLYIKANNPKRKKMLDPAITPESFGWVLAEVEAPREAEAPKNAQPEEPAESMPEVVRPRTTRKPRTPKAKQ